MEQIREDAETWREVILLRTAAGIVVVDRTAAAELRDKEDKRLSSKSKGPLEFKRSVALAPSLHTYLIHKNLTGKAVSREEFIQRLKSFSRNAVIRLSSILNIMLSKWEGDYDFDAHAKLVRMFFPPDIATKILETGRLAFHRHQLLHVAQEAMRHCSEETEDMSGPYYGNFGVLLLMASELLYCPLPPGKTPSEELARKICQILPDMEANGLQSYQTKIARSLAMCTRFIEPFRDSASFVDVPSLFEESSGLPLETYHALLFGSLARFTKLDRIKELKNPIDFAVSEDWFRNTIVPAEHLNRFFEYVAADSIEFAQIVNRQNPQANDFRIFRDKPLLRDGKNFYPIDLSLLAEKFESGPFWRVNASLSPQSREKLHNFWGTVFEAYLNWLMSSSVDGKVNKFYPNPRYAGKPDEQVCDAIVVSGRTAVLIEAKGSTFTVAAKYGGDPGVLDAELTEKLVGTAKKRKGVHQLADAVRRLCSRNATEKIEGLDLYDVTTAFPLIITRDDLGSAFHMNAYLNFHFQQLTKDSRFGRSVTPLFCMSADDLEKLSPFLNDTSLATVLSSRYKADPGLNFSFWTTDNATLIRKGARKPNLLMDETEKLIGLTIKRLGLRESI